MDYMMKGKGCKKSASKMRKNNTEPYHFPPNFLNFFFPSSLFHTTITWYTLIFIYKKRKICVIIFYVVHIFLFFIFTHFIFPISFTLFNRILYVARYDMIWYDTRAFKSKAKAPRKHDKVKAKQFSQWLWWYN